MNDENLNFTNEQREHGVAISPYLKHSVHIGEAIKKFIRNFAIECGLHHLTYRSTT